MRAATFAVLLALAASAAASPVVDPQKEADVHLAGLWIRVAAAGHPDFSEEGTLLVDATPGPGTWDRTTILRVRDLAGVRFGNTSGETDPLVGAGILAFPFAWPEREALVTGVLEAESNGSVERSPLRLVIIPSHPQAHVAGPVVLRTTLVQDGEPAEAVDPARPFALRVEARAWEGPWTVRLEDAAAWGSIAGAPPDVEVAPTVDGVAEAPPTAEVPAGGNVTLDVAARLATDEDLSRVHVQARAVVLDGSGQRIGAQKFISSAPTPAPANLPAAVLAAALALGAAAALRRPEGLK